MVVDLDAGPPAPPERLRLLPRPPGRRTRRVLLGAGVGALLVVLLLTGLRAVEHAHQRQALRSAGFVPVTEVAGTTVWLREQAGAGDDPLSVGAATTGGDDGCRVTAAVVVGYLVCGGLLQAGRTGVVVLPVGHPGAGSVPSPRSTETPRGTSTDEAGDVVAVELRWPAASARLPVVSLPGSDLAYAVGEVTVPRAGPLLGLGVAYLDADGAEVDACRRSPDLPCVAREPVAVTDGRSALG